MSQEREGEILTNKHGEIAKIIKYNKYNDVIIQFQDEFGYSMKVTYGQLKNKTFKNPYRKNVYGVGYFGDGNFTAGLKEQNRNKYICCYSCWNGMLKRCYSDEDFYNNIKNTTYQNCTVCEEWHNFQNFAKWYYDNYYDIGEELDIEKDIISKNNKIYSPTNCILCPTKINKLFIKLKKVRGDYPIGVTKCSKGKGYVARCSTTDKMGKVNKVYLGLFNTPEEAFEAYKTFKEQYIKEVADEYKDRIPQKLYEAMYRYEVEIDD